MSNTIYSLITGEILRNVDGADDQIAIQCGVDEACITTGSDDSTQYVDLKSGFIMDKQDFDVNSIPAPCLVTIEGVVYTCETSPVISFADPGSYKVYVDAGPNFLTKEFVINVD